MLLNPCDLFDAVLYKYQDQVQDFFRLDFATMDLFPPAIQNTKLNVLYFLLMLAHTALTIII